MEDKKKYIIHCDLEGITGIVRQDQVNPMKQTYEYGRKLFMAELASLVEGLHDGGAEEIYMYDHHYFGTNIDILSMPPYTRAICGKPLYKDNWIGKKSSPFSGVILLGFHSKAETPGGLLPHSYEFDIKDIRINGLSVGEIGMEAAIAGYFGVPVLMVTGDSEGIIEAKKILNNIKSVVVKEAIGSSSAVCYPIEYTSSMIKNAAKEVVKNPPDVSVFKIESPVKLEVELYQTPFLKAMKKYYKEDFTGQENVVTIHGKNVADTWRNYLEKKLYCLAKLED